MISTMAILLMLAAPDPAVFKSELIFPPEDFHNHSSSIVETAEGDLIACWFHGKGERKDDTLVIRGARKNKGASEWSAPFILADNKNLPDQNCTLFIDRDQRLWMFWCSAIDNEVRSYFPMYRYSTDYNGDGPPVWDWQDALFVRPKDAETAFPELLKRRIKMVQETDLLTEEMKTQILNHFEERREMYSDKLFQRIGWLPRQPPIMLSDKRMMLGLYSDTFDCSMFAFTEDAGETWDFSRPLVPFGIQPSIVQKKNGDLIAYMRASPKTTCVESSDGGMTWTEVPLDILNSGASVAALALESGNWILAVNDVPDGRHQLSLYLSEDEGETWIRKRYLEKLDPEKGNVTASYPTLIQAADGMVHATYTYVNEEEAKGKAIKHAWFNEDWILTGSSYDK
ncbi:MAG: exo-alpha-sialidase [Candidatus Omnitrophica bacterium]|nr:exo-alpha-sialidase [Candidatus Omnitrophota bacterium]